jgi:hypothetical protein
MSHSSRARSLRNSAGSAEHKDARSFRMRFHLRSALLAQKCSKECSREGGKRRPVIVPAPVDLVAVVQALEHEVVLPHAGDFQVPRCEAVLLKTIPVENVL